MIKVTLFIVFYHKNTRWERFTKTLVSKAECGQKPACGLVRVAHCPYGALGGGACGQRLAAVGNCLQLSTDVSRCA
ncbi:hypothetical protein XfCFBP8078_10065 [Xylella fastidiosa subsp. multiplex]|nr:hypothetical protein XfCFBP8078_10065 [Xylella fastidiosa subsp. multiplex]